MPPSNSPNGSPRLRSLIPGAPAFFFSEDSDRVGLLPLVDSTLLTQANRYGNGIIASSVSQPPTVMPPPGHYGTLFSQFLSLPGDNDIRFRRHGARRGSVREADPRLNTSDQAYGQRIPTLLPDPPQSSATTTQFNGGVQALAAVVSREEEENNCPIQSPNPPMATSLDMAAASSSSSATAGGRIRQRDTINPDPFFLPPPAVATQDNASNRPFSSSTPSRRYLRTTRPRHTFWPGHAAEAERDRERDRERERERQRARERMMESEYDLPAWALPPARLRNSIRALAERTEQVQANLDMMRAAQRRLGVEYTLPLPTQNHSRPLEQTMRYLSRLRTCGTVGESLRLALECGISRDNSWHAQDSFRGEHDDFVLDTRMLSTSHTSWLNIGAVFWGNQTTIPTASTDLHVEHRGYSPSRWTVKVNISGVDYESMKLTGTMEAYADWAAHQNQSETIKPASDEGVKSITTYLEGEIVDLKIHSLHTTSYASTISDDAKHWSKLEPFSSLSMTDLIAALTSKKFLKNLSQEYVLMRWKEKCFINRNKCISGDTSDGSGYGDRDSADANTQDFSGSGGILTIGGFYYVSMRRSDGYIKGYYYDPKSNPFQELVLKPKKRVFPTYEFR